MNDIRTFFRPNQGSQSWHRTAEFSEIPLKDPRLLIGLLGILALLVFWVLQYGIYRYAAALELLGSFAAVLLVQRLPRWRNVALLATLLLVVADTRRPDWGHIGRDQASAGIVVPAIPGDSLVVIASQEPLAYVALGMPESVRLVAVWNNMMEPAQCSGLQSAGYCLDISSALAPARLCPQRQTGIAPAAVCPAR